VKFQIVEITAQGIPTLSQWALVLLALAIGGIAASRLSRRRGFGRPI